jgi:hypothetical protein
MVLLTPMAAPQHSKSDGLKYGSLSWSKHELLKYIL